MNNIIFIFRSTGLQVDEGATIDFGLEWMDKLADETADVFEDIDEEDAGMEEEEEEVEDPVEAMKEMFGLAEFMDLIKTFLAGEISDISH